MLPELVTDFGNAAVLLLLTLALAAWIAGQVSWRAAAVWLACVAAVASLTAMAKIWFAGCQYELSHIHSPSGHTSFSLITYGGLAVVFAAGFAGLQRWLILGAGLAWATSIGITRVILHAHTVQEVVAGVAIGGTGVTVFAALYRGRQRPGIVAMAMLAAIGIGLVLMPWTHVTLESDWRWIGHWLARRVPMCV
jgi:membrane-associated phospholipid phosphatase